MSLDLPTLHPEDASHPNLTVSTNLRDVPQPGPDVLGEADLVPSPPRYGDLQHLPSLPLTDEQVADSS